MKEKYSKFKNYYLLIKKLFKYYDEEHKSCDSVYKAISPGINLQKKGVS